MTDQAKDSREISAEIALSTGSLLPGGKISLGFKRSYEKRGEELLQRTLDATGLDESELSERIAVGDGFTDITQLAWSRAIETADPFVHDAMTSLIVAALNGDEKIDTIPYILKKIEGLTPLQLRLIGRFPENPVPSIEVLEKLGEYLMTKVIGIKFQPPEDNWVKFSASLFTEHSVGTYEIAYESQLTSTVNAEPIISHAALVELSTAGFLVGVPDLESFNYVPVDPKASIGQLPLTSNIDPAWKLQPLGRLTREVLTKVGTEGTGSDAQ